MATKSTPDGVDLKLSNYSTTAAMNGSIASANSATLATAAANYGLKTVVDQHSLDIAARITPLEVDTKVANALREPRRLHLGAAGLQADASALTAYAGCRNKAGSRRRVLCTGTFLVPVLTGTVSCVRIRKDRMLMVDLRQVHFRGQSTVQST